MTTSETEGGDIKDFDPKDAVRLINLFSRSLEPLGLIGITVNLNPESLEFRQVSETDSFGGHVEVDGRKIIVLVPEGAETREADPIFVEEMAHALHLSVNPNIRVRLKEFQERGKELEPYWKFKDTHLLAARSLLEEEGGRKVAEHVQNRAEFLGLHGGFDAKNWLCGMVSGRERAITYLGFEPGVIVRMYLAFFGQDEIAMGLENLMRRYYQKYQATDVPSMLEEQDLERDIYQSDKYLQAKKRLLEAIVLKEESALVKLLKISGCTEVLTMGIVDAILKSVDALTAEEAKAAVLKIVSTHPTRLDLEVLAYNLQLSLFKGDYSHFLGLESPPEVRFTDQELVNQIRQAVDCLNGPVYITGVLRQYLLFQEKNRLGGFMLEAVNSLRYNDYPDSLFPDSPLLQEPYQRMLKEMMKQFEKEQWQGCVGRTAYDVPVADPDTGGIYAAGDAREATIDSLKQRLLFNQQDYEHQSTSHGLADAWSTLQRVYDILYLETGSTPGPTEVLRWVNEVLIKRVKQEDEKAEMDLMAEPVAKLLAQMANGGSATTVEFPRDTVFGRGYSWSLTSRDLGNIARRTEYLQGLERLIRERGSSGLLMFMMQPDIASQLDILGLGNS